MPAEHAARLGAASTLSCAWLSLDVLLNYMTRRGHMTWLQGYGLYDAKLLAAVAFLPQSVCVAVRTRGT